MVLSWTVSKLMIFSGFGDMY